MAEYLSWSASAHYVLPELSLFLVLRMSLLVCEFWTTEMYVNPFVSVLVDFLSRFILFDSHIIPITQQYFQDLSSQEPL